VSSPPFNPTFVPARDESMSTLTFAMPIPWRHRSAMMDWIRSAVSFSALELKVEIV
jgi:hypothetical protein